VQMSPSYSCELPQSQVRILFPGIDCHLFHFTRPHRRAPIARVGSPPGASSGRQERGR
jgi:hypothetical protein